MPEKRFGLQLWTTDIMGAIKPPLAADTVDDLIETSNSLKHRRITEVQIWTRKTYATLFEKELHTLAETYPDHPSEGLQQVACQNIQNAWQATMKHQVYLIQEEERLLAERVRNIFDWAYRRNLYGP